MLTLRPTTTEAIEMLYKEDSFLYGNFPPYMEIAALKQIDLDLIINGKHDRKNSVVEFTEDEFEPSFTRLAEFCFGFQRNEYDPAISGEMFRQYLLGYFPSLTDEKTSFGSFAENHFSDFAVMILGYISNTTDLQILLSQIPSETRRKFIKTKVMVYDSIVQDVFEALGKGTKVKDRKKFVSDILLALGNLYSYNAFVYENNLSSDDTRPLDMTISSAIDGSRKIAEIFYRASQLTLMETVSISDRPAIEETITQPVEL